MNGLFWTHLVLALLTIWWAVSPLQRRSRVAQFTTDQEDSDPSSFWTRVFCRIAVAIFFIGMFVNGLIAMSQTGNFDYPYLNSPRSIA